MIRRREFITLLGGAAAWPVVARAQPGERMRRLGMLTVLAAYETEAQARVTAFAQGLQELGWTTGRNVRIDYRWAAVDAERARKGTAELLALNPDVIVVVSSAIAWWVHQLNRTVPIVFVNASQLLARADEVIE